MGFRDSQEGVSGTSPQPGDPIEGPNLTPPEASISVSPSSPSAGDSVTFDGSGSTSEGSIESYSWSFGDGASGSGSVTKHAYKSGGDYSVSLTIKDEFGLTDTASTTVSVSSDGGGGTTNEPPSAEINFTPNPPDPGETVTFSGGASSDPDGSIVSYSWDFGDGSTGGGGDATHTYSSEGTYNVTLTVTDDAGATASTTVEVLVGDGVGDKPGEPPTAKFTVSPQEPAAGDEVEFDAANTSDPDGDIERYRWSFDDGSSAEGPKVTHTFDTRGSYDVLLIVIDSNDNRDDRTKTVSVGASEEKTKPVASFEFAPASPTPGTEINFDASASRDPDGQILTYEWDFGDGATARGTTPNHSFGSEQVYDVSLTVTDDDGLSETVTKEVAVSRSNGGGNGGNGGNGGSGGGGFLDRLRGVPTEAWVLGGAALAGGAIALSGDGDETRRRSR